MPSFLEKFFWLLKKGGRTAGGNAAYYVEHPSEAPLDLWEWIKENKLTCALIAGGILVIIFPLAIGFGPAGPVLGSIAAGWQASLGSVAAGSLFAVLQTMAMTGVFTGIGALLIAGGLLKSIGKGFWSFMTRVSDYGRYLVDATVRLLLGEGRA